MASRLELHEELCALLGSRHVYFQPPETVKMTYPAIRYVRDGGAEMRADDKFYKFKRRYTVTVITKDPDQEIGFSILKHFPYCRMERNYIADNLNHEVLLLYY